MRIDTVFDANKVAYKFRLFFYSPLCSRIMFMFFMWSLRLPYVSKFSLLMYLKHGERVYPLKYSANKYRNRPIFMVYEPRFECITKELEGHGIHLIYLPRVFFDQLFRKHLSDYIKENNAKILWKCPLETYEHYKEERKCYLVDCTRFGKLLKKYFQGSTIIFPKYNDDYTLEVIQAFQNSGWRTIIYDREGTVTKRRLEKIAPIVAKQASSCDHVVTYNQMHRKFFEKVFSVSDIATPEIIVMGNPASDEWFLDEKLRQLAAIPPKAGHRKILFFAFGEFSYVYDSEYLNGKDQVWRALLTDIHRVFSEHLSDYPHDELRYKRGPKGERDYWLGSEILLANSNACLIPNTASANELIVQSDIIVAFQTTALFDAMHTEKIIIYCAWGENYQELKNDLIEFEDYAREGAILHARSPEEFKQMLSLNPQEMAINIPARKKIRELFTSNPDGMVAKRFANWVVGLPSNN